MSTDLKTKIKITPAFNIASITSSTTTAGVEIDTVGYDSLTFALQLGARTDGNYTLLVQHSNTSGSGYVDVADDYLVGLESETTLSTANSVSKIGVLNFNRYVKISVVSAGVTSGATVGALAILGSPRTAPVA